MNSSRPTGSGRVGSYRLPPRVRDKGDALAGELVRDVSGVRERPGETIELGDHELFPGPAGGQFFTQSRSSTIRAGQPVVDVKHVGVHAESEERFALGGQVLLVRRDAGVSDHHPPNCSV
ncbi:hypothetical protein GCM10023169_03310 [Georgenia halophila]|uniref:Uncharacterized protein n=1 Tax=Georgenia halophila TaxID=620889 RepID=A0ABP8KU10_9MICO